MVLSWRRRCLDFNHDWLQNDYIRALRARIEKLERGTFRLQAEQHFFRERFPGWLQHREEAAALVEEFEREMSPSALLQKPPLAGISPDVAMWLGPLVSDLWRTRGGLWG